MIRRIAPYAYSSVAGFTQHLDAGSQVATITNTQTLTPNFNVAEVFGFIREKILQHLRRSHLRRRSSPRANLTGSPADWTINTFGSSIFPRHHHRRQSGSPDNTDGPRSAATSAKARRLRAPSPGFSRTASCRRPMPSGLKGKHTITFGGSSSYTQLNTRDRRTGRARSASPIFRNSCKGMVTPYSVNGFITTTFLQATRIATTAPTKRANIFRTSFSFART